MKRIKSLILVFFAILSLAILSIGVSAEDTKSATYTFGGTKITGWTVSTTGDAPEGSSASYTQTYEDSVAQITSGNSLTLTISGYAGNTIRNMVFSMHSNSSKGTGKFSAKVGSTTLAEISSNTTFNSGAWHGSWSATYVDVEPAMTNDDYCIQEGEDIVITISASANSLYCQSITLNYLENSSLTKLEAPTCEFNEKNISITTHTSNKYEVGLFYNVDDTAPFYTYTDIVGDSFEIPFKPQGTYYSRIKALGDGETTSNSLYSTNYGIIINDTISTISITAAQALPHEASAPFTYYEITGEVSNFEGDLIYLSDGDNEINIYRLKDTDKATILNAEASGIVVGTSITVIIYKTIYEKDGTVEYQGYLKNINYTLVDAIKNSKTEASLDINYHYEITGTGDISYHKITSNEELLDGLKVVMVCENYNAVASNLNGKYIDKEDINIFDNSFSTDKSITIFTLSDKGDSTWTFTSNDGVLGVTGEKDLAYNSGTTTWSINISSGDATIASTNSTYGKLQYNASDPRFKTYTTTQKNIQLYKVQEDKTATYDINEASMRFGATIEKDLYDEIMTSSLDVEFGVFYNLSKNISGENISDTYKTIGNTSEFMKEVLIPVRVNEQGEEDINGDYYQFALVLTEISEENFTDLVSATVYIKITDQYIFMKDSVYSVKTLSNTYCKNYATNEAVKPHLGVLEYISKLSD